MKNRIDNKIIAMVVAFAILLCAVGIIYYFLSVNTGQKGEGFRLHISSGYNQEMDIPDPSTINGTANITICPVEEDTDYDARVNESQMVDFSFLGLKEKACIINYATGRSGNSKKDNCLALTLGTKKSEFAYLAVLDYKNRKSYLVKTGQLVNNVDQLNKCDLTDDGRDEWIVSGIANTWIEWQAYRISDGKLKEIRSRYYDAQDENATNFLQNAFTVKFISDYEIKISCKDADFEKVINVKDVENLEYQQVDVINIIDWDAYSYDYFQNIDMQKGICFPLEIEVGFGNICGKIQTYLKYDKDTDMLEIDKVIFKEVRE
jgi:flagellar basal body-associated protein FliL